MLEKQKIRERILSKRRSLAKEEWNQMSVQVKEKLFSLDEFEESKTLSLYVAIDNEVGTIGMIRDALDRGKRVAVPCTRGRDKSLLLSEVRDVEKELTPQKFGILEPKKEYLRVVPYNEIDLMIVPGVAFDEEGGRLGYGGGYYDKLLTNLNRSIRTVGLAFELQMVEQVPQGSHDVFVDKIVTERRIIDCFLTHN